jgi:hypothetical protein
MKGAQHIGTWSDLGATRGSNERGKRRWLAERNNAAVVKVMAKAIAKIELKSSVRLGLRGRAPCKEVYKILKCRVKATRAFKSKRVTNSAGILMALAVGVKFFRMFTLNSFAMFEAVRSAGGRRHEVA